MPLEGSFVLCLVDQMKEKIFLYRNFVGANTFYFLHQNDLFCFGSNLGEVARRGLDQREVDEEVLPLFFIYRSVPDHRTLFRGIHKLLPGQLLTFEQGKVNVAQAQTLADLRMSDPIPSEEAVDRIESTMLAVLRDYDEMNSNTANLLSGGVDSSYIQAIWNRICSEKQNGLPSLSAAVWVDHPRTKADKNYTETAVDFFSTRHLSVPIDTLSLEMMEDYFRLTGEMPNHVQTFLFHPLAKGMAENQMSAGLCGEGADGLFGADGPDRLLGAARWKKRIPLAFIRTGLAGLAEKLQRDVLPGLLELSNHLHDLQYRKHPINSAGAFHDAEKVLRYFGETAYDEALKQRRMLLSLMGVAEDPLLLQWATGAGYYGEAIHTAVKWNAIFQGEGIQLGFPFLDSRMIRAVGQLRLEDRFVLRNPKKLLKKSLEKYASEEFVRRPKRGFGQPIDQWLSEGGPLRKAVEEIEPYSFIPNEPLQLEKKSPGPFLYSLLCFDRWHKMYIHT